MSSTSEPTSVGQRSDDVSANGGDNDEAPAEAALDRLFPARTLRRVLLVTPPDADASLFRPDTARRRRYTNYPPYGLAVLARHLRDAGVEVRLCNLNHEVLKQANLAPDPALFRFDEVWRTRLARELADFAPELVAVTCMFTMTHASLRAVTQAVAATGVPVAIGGVHVSNDIERILDDLPHAAFAFLREADESLPRFVRVVNRQLPARELRQVVLNERPARLRFLREALPSGQAMSVIPAYDLLQLDEYTQYGTIGSFYFLKPPGTRIATVLANRGCRGSCTFCSVRTFNGPGVRHRSVGSVLDELELLQDRHGVEHVMWLDDDLLHDGRRALELFNGMVRRGLRLTWDATNGVIAASCTEEVVAAAAASGCIAINIGVETGNAELLRRVRKPATLDAYVRAADVLRGHPQIHTSAFLMIGFPGETMAMILETIELARRMDLDWYRISQLQPLPNTPIYDAMVAQGLIQDVGTKELRFMGGAYGKQTDMEQGRVMASPDFRRAFSSIAPDAVPTAAQLTDVWFYMNYHLNFQRLFGESRPIKMAQQLANLRCLGDVISPENGFSLYFQGVLQHRLGQPIDGDLIERLRRRLDTSPYWRDRFAAFGLALEDLENGRFDAPDVRALFAGAA